VKNKNQPAANESHVPGGWEKVAVPDGRENEMFEQGYVAVAVGKNQGI
jgi:hypothetical protein